MARTDDHGQLVVKVDYEKKCTCTESDRQPRMVNYSMMWHEADIICGKCNGFIRYWDAG